MNPEERILAALKALADADRGAAARPEVEARVLAAFRRRQRIRVWSAAAWAVAAAAAVVAALLVHDWRPKPQRVQVAIAPETRDSGHQAVEESGGPVAVVAATRRVAAHSVTSRRQPREIVTDFFPLLDAAPPFESGELIRVTVPASTMRRVGLPVNEDRADDPILADVLIGQEGLARAIRFVSVQ